MPKLPQPGKLNAQQLSRYRALLAFQLRASGFQHEGIAAVMKFRSKNHSRSMVAKGRRLMTECVIDTVPY